jgi:hypothetical protein
MMERNVSEYRNMLMEAVLRDPDLGEHAWRDSFIGKAKGNILFQRTMKEYVLSDVSQALGKVYDLAVEAAEQDA